jgi:hypothetical protein
MAEQENALTRLFKGWFFENGEFSWGKTLAAVGGVFALGWAAENMAGFFWAAIALMVVAFGFMVSRDGTSFHGGQNQGLPLSLDGTPAPAAAAFVPAPATTPPPAPTPAASPQQAAQNVHSSGVGR